MLHSIYVYDISMIYLYQLVAPLKANSVFWKLRVVVVGNDFSTVNTAQVVAFFYYSLIVVVSWSHSIFPLIIEFFFALFKKKNLSTQEEEGKQEIRRNWQLQIKQEKEREKRDEIMKISSPYQNQTWSKKKKLFFFTLSWLEYQFF